VPGWRDFPRGNLRLDATTLLAKSANSETYGRLLGQALFAEDAILHAYQEATAVFQSRGEGGRVRLRLGPPELHDLRWERVYHPVAGAWHPLAATADTLLSRYILAREWERPAPLTARPLRVLVIIASPRNVHEYGLDPISEAESETWHTVFDDLPDVAPLYLQSGTGSPPAFANVRRALMDGYHVVHFVCHGAKIDQGTVLYLENVDGTVAPVGSERLLEMFRALATRPRLCFLTACESGARGRADAFVPLGPALVAGGGVPAVVAMADRVGIVTARQFSSGFYARLLAHGAVDLAVNEARAMVRERWDWSVPVLFSRLPDNQLLDVPEVPTEGRRSLDVETRPARGALADLALAEKTEFVNRENELRLLQVERLRASRSPYTLISAPAGYGKSCLLRHMIRAVESDETLRQKWCVRYVDFALSEGDHEDQVGYLLRVVTGELRNQVSSEKPGFWNGPDTAIDWLCDHVVQELGAPVAGGRCAVVLILDAVERLDERSRQWLYTLLHELYQRTCSGPREIITVRVIVAGRNVELFWDGYRRAYPALPAPQRIGLNPFDERPIQELIWGRAGAIRIELDDQTVVQVAGEIQYLSGGHPAVIRGLVDDLAGRSFAVGLASEYFERRREGLVRAIISPVAGDLLVGLESGVGETVRILSVFRRVNANTVQALVETGVLPPGTNAIDLLGDMQRAHLLAGPGIREPFYRDSLMRRVLVLDMAHASRESRALYHRLNRIARDLYETWIHNLGRGLPDTPLKATQRLLSVVEWLFHALQDESVDDDGLRTGLQAHVGVLSEGSPSLSVADLIADEIAADAEMRYLLCHRLGDEGVSVACGWLRSA